MEMFAYIGMEEIAGRPQRVGIKQGMVPAGFIPLVVMDYDRAKLMREDVVKQLQAQANKFGQSIRLARFTYIDDVLTLHPQAGTSDVRAG